MSQTLPSCPGWHMQPTSFPFVGEVWGLVCSNASSVGTQTPRQFRIPIGTHGSSSSHAYSARSVAISVVSPAVDMGQGSDSTQTPSFWHGESPRATQCPPQSKYSPCGARNEHGSSRMQAPIATHASPHERMPGAITSQKTASVGHAPPALHSAMQCPPRNRPSGPHSCSPSRT